MRRWHCVGDYFFRRAMRQPGITAEPEQHDLNMITSDPKQVAELRGRLASLSWFMPA